MTYKREDLVEALKYLNENFPDAKVNNNKSIISDSVTPITVTEEYRFTSMKQSIFRNVCYDGCLFENVALTGSSLDFVSFVNTSIIGSSFANCDFYMVDMNGNNKILEANNFSQSNFERCNLSHVEMFKSGVLNALFHNCNLQCAYFHGSTFEGTKFINCKLNDCDFGSVNLDYTVFSKNIYENVVFPFYQIAYIIGAADFINDKNNKISIRAGDKQISSADYIKILDKLICYYLDKSEYFPVCNLLIAQKKFNEARKFLMDGVLKALSVRNFRMLSNYCQLAKYHGIINDRIRYKIVKSMDEFIQLDNIPETQLNYYLIYIGKIKTLLNEGSNETVTLNYTIKTNTCKKNEDGVKYVNDLVNVFNTELSSLDNIEGFEVSISNHSPFEIAIGVITIIGEVANVAKFIMDMIAGGKKKIKDKKERESAFSEIEKSGYFANKYIDERIERLKYEIKDINQKYKGKTFNKYIDEITQSLKTDMEELYSKEIMFIKLKNTKK